jgi:hypothetical protein
LELAEERLQAAAKRLAGAEDFGALHDIVNGEILVANRPFVGNAFDRLNSWYRQADGVRHRASPRRIFRKIRDNGLSTSRDEGRRSHPGVPRRNA